MEVLDSGEKVPRTREDYVADRIRNSILRGDFKPGERLDEHDIAQHLNVSRTPVRSALRMLAAESLIDLQPHRGAIVSELSPDELEEVYLIRGILEGMATRLAVANLDENQVEMLEVTLRRMEAATDPDSWLALNNRFHHSIYQAANSPRLLSIIEYVRNIATPYIRQFVDVPENMESSRSDHRHILAACKQRDATLAEAAIRKHLQDVCLAHVQQVTATTTIP